MRLLDVETLVRLHDFSGFRVHAVDRDMEMVIVRIVVKAIYGLMPGQLHAFQKNIHQFLHLFSGRLLRLFPRKYPVRDRHFAVCGLSGEGDHFHFLPVMRSGNEVPPARVFNFFLRIPVVGMTDIIHQIADLPRLGFVVFFVFNFLDDHGGRPR